MLSWKKGIGMKHPRFEDEFALDDTTLGFGLQASGFRLEVLPKA
jgi:hypothetical protein